MLIKTNLPGWSKDSETGAVVQTDLREYQALKLKRQEARDRKDFLDRIDNIAKRLEELETKFNSLTDIIADTNKTVRS